MKKYTLFSVAVEIIQATLQGSMQDFEDKVQFHRAAQAGVSVLTPGKNRLSFA